MEILCLPIMNVGMSGATSVFSSEYQAVYNKLVELGDRPPLAIAINQNILVKSLVSTGVWVKKDLFFIFAQYSNNGGGALINWKNPGTFDATIENGSMAFVSLEGLAGNGIAPHIDTNWNPNTDSINYVLDSATGGVYIRTNVKESKTEFGSKDGTNYSLYCAARNDSGVDGQFFIRMNATLFDSAETTDSRGLWITSRTASNVVKGYRNKTEITSSADISTAIPSKNVYIAAYNNNDTPANLSSKQYSMYFAGSGFTQQNVDDLTDAVEAYMDSNGKGVIT